MSPPGPIDGAVRRAVRLLSDRRRPDDEQLDLEQLRAQAADVAASEEDLLLLALFGDEAQPLLRTIRSRGRRDETLARGSVDQARAERIREVVRLVQESGVAEITIEEAGTRVSVRPGPEGDGLIRVEAPMVGTFYRAPEPGAAPFVEEGDAVARGQTLCILEAMKLMNEVKADVEGIVRRICVDNAQAVQYGDLLFELEPLNGRPLDAL